MISLSTIAASSLEGILIEEDGEADYRDNTARVSRVKTLDGGVHITHSGTVDGDRTLRVNAVVNEAETDILWALFNGSTFIHVSTKDGFYVAVISELKIDQGNIKMIIIIKSKEA
jgi:hypothetical protein